MRIPKKKLTKASDREIVKKKSVFVVCLSFILKFDIFIRFLEFLHKYVIKKARLGWNLREAGLLFGWAPRAMHSTWVKMTLYKWSYVTNFVKVHIGLFSKLSAYNVGGFRLRHNILSKFKQNPNYVSNMHPDFHLDLCRNQYIYYTSWNWNDRCW